MSDDSHSRDPRVDPRTDPGACGAARDRLGPYLDGELSSPERREVEGHLTGCTECRRLFERDREAWNLLGKLAPAPPGAGGAELILAVRRRILRRGRVRRISAWTAAAALLLAATSIAWFLPGSFPGAGEEQAIIDNLMVLEDLALPPPGPDDGREIELSEVGRELLAGLEEDSAAGDGDWLDLLEAALDESEKGG